MYFFTVVPISQPVKDLTHEMFQALKTGVLIQIHFWELQTFQSFGQTTSCAAKQTYSLHGEKASTFENTTVLSCLSTAVLPAYRRSLCPPPTTSLTSITSQQTGEETWTHCLYQFHKFPCATGHSSGGWGCAFWSHMDYMLLPVFKHSVGITRDALLGEKNEHQTEKVTTKLNLRLLTSVGSNWTCMTSTEMTWHLNPSHSITTNIPP